MTTTKDNKKEYTEAAGRRKTSVARVRLFDDTKDTFVINGRGIEDYFSRAELVALVKSVFKESGTEKNYSVSVQVKGGGVSSQAEAACHGIARALTEIDPDLRQKLKKAGFLKRDPRRKERKKFGLKKARRSPQWSKR
ncbi:MAG: 30S ribosomal protein S9 [Patescibacteria group bacterium]